MASDNSPIRTWSRARRFLNISTPNDFASSAGPSTDIVHTGMFATGELRHLGDIGEVTSPNPNRRVSEESITSFIKEIGNNTRKKIDEIRNLKLMAPEINQAQTIIVSTIISPEDLQCDKIAVQVDNPELGATVNGQITDYLSTFFNETYHLAPKLARWYGDAGFVEGAKAILILPKEQINVLNTIADELNPEEKKRIEEYKREIAASTEDLIPVRTFQEDRHIAALEDYTSNLLLDMKVKKTSVQKKDNKEVWETANDVSASVEDTKALARNLLANSFKLLKHTEDGNGVIVTRDMSLLTKTRRNNTEAIKDLERKAMKQMHGFMPGFQNGGGAMPGFPVLCLSDMVDAKENDLPIVIEIPADSVIPVCAPHDNRNHIGYFVLIDENGQPIRGQYAFGLNGGQGDDITNRLAMNAAQAVFGSTQMAAFNYAANNSDSTMIDQMTQIFSVAVNHILESKLNKDGLMGLDVNVHTAVGKALFFNLLSKTKVKMIFIPASMMVYYCFDHREDGTGKTFIEDNAFIIALRNTLTIARIMSAIENATLNRRIEVNVDEKETNVEQLLNIVRRQYVAKRAPSFFNDPRSCTEAILNSHVSVVPKAIAGTTDDLSVTTEKAYGSGQNPDESLNDTLNNWTALGFQVPSAAINALSEHEFSRSVATQNLVFANKVRTWQDILTPENKKFICNFILCDGVLRKGIRDLIEKSIAPSKEDNKEANKNQGTTAGDKTAATEISKDKSKDIDRLLYTTIASARIVLSPPNVAVNKAHFEDITAQIEAVNRVVETLYPDDLVMEDELKSMVASLRAQISSSILREYLPKLGFHQIASIPELDELDPKYSKKLLLFLNNQKRRFAALYKMVSGQMSSEGSEEGGEDNPPDGGDVGGEDEFS